MSGSERRLELGALGRAELARVRAEAVALLESHGVVVPGELARAALAEAGAPVERATDVARLPARLIEDALALVPTTPVLGGRSPERDVTLGRLGLLATGGPAFKVSTGDGERRPAAHGDLAEACRLADGLPEVAVVAGPPLTVARSAAAGDRTAEGERPRAAILEELEVCLASTAKHVLLTTVTSPAEAEAVAAMALAVAGADHELRRRPPVSIAAPRPASEPNTVDALFIAARHGLPVSFALGLPHVAAADPAAPATARGEAVAEAGGLGDRLARLGAGALAAAAVVQLVAPGAAFIACFSAPSPPQALPHAPPSASPGLAGGPSDWYLSLAYNEVMSSFGLPSLVLRAAGGAAEPGWRSSLETTFAALVAALGRPSLLAGAGLLAGGRAFSPGQLVLDCESHAVCTRIAQGIEVDEETMALETIAAAGVGGNALGQRHTRRHMRDVWRPRVFDRSSLEAWQREGRVGSEKKAKELATRILAEHEVPPLEAEKAETLARIIATSGL